MMSSTRIRKSWYCWGRASVSVRISFFESFLCGAAGIPADAASPEETLAEGEVGATAAPDGPSTASVFALPSPRLGKRSASFPRSSVFTAGGVSRAADSSIPAALICSAAWASAHAAWQAEPPPGLGQRALAGAAEGEFDS